MNKHNLVWIATIGTMSVMLFIWASALPSTIKVESSDNTEITKLTEEVGGTFEEFRKTIDDAGNVLGQAVSAEQSEPTTENNETAQDEETPVLTEEQIEYIKAELNKPETEEIEVE